MIGLRWTLEPSLLHPECETIKSFSPESGQSERVVGWLASNASEADREYVINALNDHDYVLEKLKETQQEVKAQEDTIHSLCDKIESLGKYGFPAHKNPKPPFPPGRIIKEGHRAPTSEHTSLWARFVRFLLAEK